MAPVLPWTLITRRALEIDNPDLRDRALKARERQEGSIVIEVPRALKDQIILAAERAKRRLGLEASARVRDLMHDLAGGRIDVDAFRPGGRHADPGTERIAIVLGWRDYLRLGEWAKRRRATVPQTIRAMLTFSFTIDAVSSRENTLEQDLLAVLFRHGLIPPNTPVAAMMNKIGG